MKRITTATALLLVAGLYSQADAEEKYRRRGEAIDVQHNQQNFVSTITVEADNGRVQWSDVMRGLSRARGYDDRSLEAALPNVSFDLDGRMASYVIRKANRMLAPNVKLRVRQPVSPTAEPQLVIDMDRQAMLSTQRRLKRRVRDVILPSRHQSRAYGLQLDDTWQKAPVNDRIVVFVHGLNSHPHTVRELCSIVRSHGMACGSFNYPNDQPIEQSGQLLSKELRAFAKRHPQRKVALVTYSMGGLVARVAIENPELDPGNVSRLIMVAPPNHGSALSQFAFGLDIWEYMDPGVRQENVCLFYSTIEDGLAEATVDLEPGSIFLTKLNRRPRNPEVQYSIFLGAGAPCTKKELDDVRRKIQKAGSWCRLCQFFGSKLDREIAGLDEVVAGKGDGAVAVRRGRLQGVEDTHVMNFGHLSILHNNGDKEVKKVYDAVLARLRS